MAKYKVSDRRIHPNYEGHATTGFDIALLKLDDDSKEIGPGASEIMISS